MKGEGRVWLFGLKVFGERINLPLKEKSASLFRKEDTITIYGKEHFLLWVNKRSILALGKF